MYEKEKIQNLFKNILSLILKYNNVYVNRLSDITEQMFSNHTKLLKNIMDINSQLSNYQLRANFDKHPEYLERIEQMEKALEEERNKTKQLENNYEFAVGQTKLNMDKINSLLEDIDFMIEDLQFTYFRTSSKKVSL